jgi:hypothetical protein
MRHDFSTTSPAFLKYPFFAFLIQLTTLYSGRDLSRPSGIASESLTLLVMSLSIISGK